MDPLRWALTWVLVGSLGVLDAFEVFTPGPADAQTLGMVHPRATSMRCVGQPGRTFRFRSVMDSAHRTIRSSRGMHDAAALIVEGSVGNDAALAIAAMLQAGVRKVAYIDVDAHHGDGVQAAFYGDPRVLTVSNHETPLSLFPRSGYPDGCGGRDGGQRRAARGHIRRVLAAGLPRGGARRGARVQA